MKQRDNKKTNKALSEYTHTHPEQLSLFCRFPDATGHYSRTIELYDAIPKYSWGKLQWKDDRFLEDIERTFVHRNVEYQVHITPARLKGKDGVSKEFLPGKREELVEDALRKLACDGKGVFLDNEVGVLFSLYELQQELKHVGHTYSIRQLKEAILICNRVSLIVYQGERKILGDFPIFQSIGLQTKEDWKGHGEKTKAFVRFHPLVTQSIRETTFHQFNYEQCMVYKNSLARWLHKRLSHNYKQASPDKLYSILLTTIIRDSGVKRYTNFRNHLRDVKLALEEMIAAEVLSECQIEKRYGERKNKISDVLFTLIPHPSFISEVIKSHLKFSNKKQVPLPDQKKVIFQYYSDYLQSDHWQEIRKRALRYYNHECALCKKKNTLNVHHKTYEHLGNEPLSQRPRTEAPGLVKSKPHVDQTQP